MDLPELIVVLALAFQCESCLEPYKTWAFPILQRIADEKDLYRADAFWSHNCWVSEAAYVRDNAVRMNGMPSSAHVNRLPSLEDSLTWVEFYKMYQERLEARAACQPSREGYLGSVLDEVRKGREFWRLCVSLRSHPNIALWHVRQQLQGIVGLIGQEAFDKGMWPGLPHK